MAGSGLVPSTRRATAAVSSAIGVLAAVAIRIWGGIRAARSSADLQSPVIIKAASKLGAISTSISMVAAACCCTNPL